ncbi:hypothetical protein Q7P36_004021 [Cladosporium allicinum]
MDNSWKNQSASHGARQHNGPQYNIYGPVELHNHIHLPQAEKNDNIAQLINDRAATPIIEHWLDAGAEPNEVGSDGMTAMDHAILKSRDHVVNKFLKSDPANVNAVNKDGKTPLALAKTLRESREKDKIIRDLVKKGATDTSSTVNYAKGSSIYPRHQANTSRAAIDVQPLADPAHDWTGSLEDADLRSLVYGYSTRRNTEYPPWFTKILQDRNIWRPDDRMLSLLAQVREAMVHYLDGRTFITQEVEERFNGKVATEKFLALEKELSTVE